MPGGIRHRRLSYPGGMRLSIGGIIRGRDVYIPVAPALAGGTEQRVSPLFSFVLGFKHYTIDQFDSKYLIYTLSIDAYTRS